MVPTDEIEKTVESLNLYVEIPLWVYVGAACISTYFIFNNEQQKNIEKKRDRKINEIYLMLQKQEENAEKKN